MLGDGVEIKFSADSLLKMADKALPSTAEIKSMKNLLDEVEDALREDPGNSELKRNVSVLTSVVTKSALRRKEAENASVISVDSLELNRQKMALARLLPQLKDGSLSPEDKTKVVTLKDSIQAAQKVVELKSQIQARAEGKKRVSLILDARLEQARKARNIAVCFLVDCTWSMDCHITAVKTQIQEVTQKYKDLYPDSAIQFAFVGYKDFDNPEMSVLNFTPHVDEFIDYVGMVRCEGGGDICEDVAGGLREVTGLSWSNFGDGSTKILVHIADAPGHGQDYNGGLNDDFAIDPTPDGKSKDVTETLRVLKSERVHYFFYRVNPRCDAMIARFNEQACGRSGIREYIVIQDLGDASKLAQTILRTFSSSVLKTQHCARTVDHRSMMACTGSGCSVLECGSDDDGTTTIPDPSELRQSPSIDWTRMDCWEVKVWGFMPITRMRTLQMKQHSLWCQMKNPCSRDGRFSVKMYLDFPFSQGACRYAYYGQCWRSGGFWEDIVLKRLIGPDGHTLGRYLRPAEESNIAVFLAKNYNEWKPPQNKPIRFAKSGVLELNLNPNQKEYFGFEELLPNAEHFTKYCTNYGDWDKMVMDKSLLDFAKYTYDATGGYMMVADLQGVCTGSEFILTDPAVLCADTDKFSSTNLGAKGMEANYEMVKKLLLEIA